MAKQGNTKETETVKVLRKKLREAEEKISELESNAELILYASLEKINTVYAEYLNLNPHRISFSNKEQFDMSVSDVLWIDNTHRRLKTVYLKNKIANVSKDAETDNIISNTDGVTFEKLLSMIDLSKNCLVQVNKKYAVNVAYFNLDNNDLKLNIKSENSTPVPTIIISKHYLANFKLKKENYTNIISYHKQLVSSHF
jgi:hypothetical protein